MITKTQKDEALATWYLGQGQLLEVIKIIEGNQELSHFWRQVALGYSDLEDVENAIKYFKIAYDAGDNKSLPWLIEILRAYSPADVSLTALEQKFNELLESGDFDVQFSLGNISLIQKDFANLKKVWSQLICTRNSAIDFNLIDSLLQDVENPFLLESLGIEVGSSRNLIFSHVEEMLLNYMNEEPRAVFTLAGLYDKFEDLIENQEEATDFYIEKVLFWANRGNISLIIQGYELTLNLEDYRFEFFKQLVEENDLNFLLRLVLSENNQEDPQGTPIQSKYLKVSPESARIDKIFEEALEAQKVDDFERETKLWLEGAKLGNTNCLFNYAIALGNQMGISCNLFGCSGAEGKIWGDLIKNIQQNGNRDFDREIHNLEIPLGANLITAASKNSGSLIYENGLEPIKEISKVNKVIDVLDELMLLYVKRAENSITIPYADDLISFQVSLELMRDETQDLIFIYSPLLYGSNELTKHEQNLIRMLIRNAALIFPLSGFNLDIFGSLPDEQHPNFFINKMDCSQIPVFVGARIDELILDFIPVKETTSQFSFGMAIPLELQSDDFLLAVRESIKIVTNVVANMQSLRLESRDLYQDNFDHLTAHSKDTESIEIDIPNQLKLNLPYAKFLQAVKDSAAKENVEPLINLATQGFKPALRELYNFKLNKNQIEQVGTLILDLYKDCEQDTIISYFLNNLGFTLDNDEKLDEAMRYFEASAKLGCANALSNITWYRLLRGDHSSAVELFNEVYYKVMISRETSQDFEQAANSRSNNALNRWALGENPEELREIWTDEYFQGDHLESKFYPILIDYLSGKTELAIEKLAQLPKFMRDELKEMFALSRENELWFGEISRSSLALLEQIK